MFSSILSWFSVNKWAAWVGGIAIAFLTLKRYEQKAVNRGKKIGEERVERRNQINQERIQVKTDETIERVIREKRERVERAAKARDGVSAPDDASELPDRIKDRFIVD